MNNALTSVDQDALFDRIDGKREELIALTQDLIRRAFDGSPSQLVVQALGAGPASSPEELQRIRDFLDQIESGEVEGR